MSALVFDFTLIAENQSENFGNIAEDVFYAMIISSLLKSSLETVHCQVDLQQCAQIQVTDGLRNVHKLESVHKQQSQNPSLHTLQPCNECGVMRPFILASRH